MATDYQQIITMQPGKRGGRPCVRGMRITVADVLGWLAAGLSHEQIIDDFPELAEADILACLAFAADLADDEALLLPPTLRRTGPRQARSLLRANGTFGGHHTHSPFALSLSKREPVRPEPVEGSR